MPRWFSLFFLPLVFFHGSVDAATNWINQEILQTQATLSISIVAFGSDGFLWRCANVPNGIHAVNPPAPQDGSSYAFVERIDPLTGAQTGSVVVRGDVLSMKPSANGSMWFTRSDSSELLSAVLKTQESRHGIDFELPSGKFYFRGKIFTRSSLQRVDIRLGSAGNPNYFGSASTGLWAAEFGGEISMVDLTTGIATPKFSLPECVTSNPAPTALAVNRAISENCIFDPQSGQVLGRLFGGMFLRGEFQLHNNYALFRTDNQLGTMRLSDGTLLWTKPAGHPEIIVAGSTVVTAENGLMQGFDIGSGELKFSLPSLDLDASKLIARDTEFVVSQSQKTSFYSSETGELRRSIAASTVQPIANFSTVAQTADAVFSASIFFDGGNRRFIQITKRTALDGQISWRQSLQLDLDILGVCNVENCYDSNVWLEATEATLLISTKFLIRSSLYSLVLSMDPNTGATRWRRDAIASNSVTNSMLIEARVLGNGAFALYRSPPTGSGSRSVEVVDAVSGESLWTGDNRRYRPLLGGDLLAFDNGAVERVNGRTGQRIWRNDSADCSDWNLIALTTDALIYRPNSVVWNPLSRRFVEIARLSLEDGSLRLQRVSMPDDISGASTTGPYNYARQAPTGTPVGLLLRHFPAFTGALSGYLLISPTGATSAFPLGNSLILRDRGLGRRIYPFRGDDPSYEFAGGLWQWIDEIDESLQPLNRWQSLPPKRFSGFERVVVSYLANTQDRERVFAERAVTEADISYWISTSPAITAAEAEADIGISKQFVGMTEAGERHYVVRVRNFGIRAVQGAQLLSENTGANRFSCASKSCKPNIGFGSVNVQLDLPAGASVDIDVYDVSVATQLIALIAPVQVVETNRSNNLLEMGRMEMLTDGFE